MATAKIEGVRTDFLEDKVITVKYITKETNGIKDNKHVAYGGLLNGAEIAIPAPTMDNGKMKNLLTKVEKEGLEYVLNGVNMSIYGDFWKEGGQVYQMGILPVYLGKDGITLDLSDPYDYIKYKILLACPIVANSIDEVKHKATNRFVLTSAKEQLEKSLKIGNSKVEAYKLFAKHEKNKEVLRYTLRNLGKATAKNSSLEFLQSQFHLELDRNATMVCDVMGHKYLKTRVLLESCYEHGVVNRVDGKYYTLDDEPICDKGGNPTIDSASHFLAINLGQDLRLALEAKLKSALK